MELTRCIEEGHEQHGGSLEQVRGGEGGEEGRKQRGEEGEEEEGH